ncbi:MAG: laccase domain-containing protein, partial [Vicinamibacterales bacterium]
PELIDAFRAAGFTESDIDRWFTYQDSGSLRLDVAAATIDQIRDAGVPRNQIHAANLCTQTHAEIFESYRAAGAKAGRMAGLIRCG